jgi:hypothetical protein
MVRKILLIIVWAAAGIVALLVILGSSISIWAMRDIKPDTSATTTASADLSPDSFSQTIHLTLINAALKNYHDQNNGLYPQSLNDLVPKYLSIIPLDDNGQPFTYKLIDDDHGYELCNVKPDGSTQCVGEDEAGNVIGL